MTIISLLYFAGVTLFSAVILYDGRRVEGALGIAVGVFGLVGSVLLLMVQR